MLLKRGSKAMTNMICTVCDQGTLEHREVTNKQVDFEGIRLTVPSATIYVCPSCGAESYSGKDLRTWQRLKQDQLIQSGQTFSPAAVTSIRERLHMSVAQFASLLGVTRQTVYGWEDTNGSGIKFGPAALVVSVLNRESDIKQSLLAELLRMAHERHQLENWEIPTPPASGPDRNRPKGANFFGRAA
jgi:hypothetical protein